MHALTRQQRDQMRTSVARLEGLGGGRSGDRIADREVLRSALAGHVLPHWKYPSYDLHGVSYSAAAMLVAAAAGLGVRQIPRTLPERVAVLACRRRAYTRGSRL